MEVFIGSEIFSEFHTQKSLTEPIDMALTKYPIHSGIRLIQLEPA